MPTIKQLDIKIEIITSYEEDKGLSDVNGSDLTDYKFKSVLTKRLARLTHGKKKLRKQIKNRAYNKD